MRAIFRAIIWSMEDRNPMEGDKLHAILNGISEDEIEEPNNSELEHVIEFFDCMRLIPLANRIIWLSSIKEARGIIPDEIPIDYEELQLLVILQEERDKKLACNNYEMRKNSKEQQARMNSGNETQNVSSTGLAGAIILNK